MKELLLNDLEHSVLEIILKENGMDPKTFQIFMALYSKIEEESKVSEPDENDNVALLEIDNGEPKIPMK